MYDKLTMAPSALITDISLCPLWAAPFERNSAPRRLFLSFQPWPCPRVMDICSKLNGQLSSVAPIKGSGTSNDQPICEPRWSKCRETVKERVKCCNGGMECGSLAEVFAQLLSLRLTGLAYFLSTLEAKGTLSRSDSETVSSFSYG